MVTTPTIIALGALLLAVVAERLHARRSRRVMRLAFPRTGRAPLWTRAAPIARCAGLALACWGATVLLLHEPVVADPTPLPRASRQLLIVLDASPSMTIADAGPGPEKMSRGRWGGRVLQAILDRLDMRDTRISMVAFYNGALPVLQDTTDRNVVSNMLDGLPLYVAFRPGPTDMASGIEAAFDMARPWARGSTTLVVISDGDLEGAPTFGPRPASIADAIVIGVGDPDRATIISGHSSRQDRWVLKELAARLRGHYHEGNTKHLPTSIVEGLGSIAPRTGTLVGLREAALASLGVGSALVGLTGPALVWFGSPRPAREKAPIARLTKGELA